MSAEFGLKNLVTSVHCMVQSIFYFSESFKPHPRVLQRDGWTDRPTESESCTELYHHISSFLCQPRIAWKFQEVHRRCCSLWIWNKCLWLIN